MDFDKEARDIMQAADALDAWFKSQDITDKHSIIVMGTAISRKLAMFDRNYCVLFARTLEITTELERTIRHAPPP